MYRKRENKQGGKKAAKRNEVNQKTARVSFQIVLGLTSNHTRHWAAQGRLLVWHHYSTRTIAAAGDSDLHYQQVLQQVQ
jgi:hypothetical protein